MVFTLKGIPLVDGQNAVEYKENSARGAVQINTFLRRDGYKKVFIIGHDGAELTELELVRAAKAEL